MRDINPGYPGAPEHRSIRSIPVGHRHPPAPPARNDAPRRPRRRYGWWVLLFAALCAIAAFLLSTVFAGATVTVYPRQVTVTPPPTLTARLDAPVGTLAYETVTQSAESSVTVAASGVSPVSRQASGVVAISNAFSAEPQRLIANTRFEAPDGKIYRIRDSVTVPGMSGATPGTITATIYADSPGASYNKSGATAFTVPGFRGDPRYSKITARSQGAIEGGFVGEQPAVAAADLAKARETLQKDLDAKVRSAVAANIPDGYGLLPGMLEVTYTELTQTPQGDEAVIAQGASAKGAMVRGSDLGAAIARSAVAGYQGEAVALLPQELEVVASSTGEGMVSISLRGSATLVWQFDPGAVRQALLGKPKAQFQTVLDSFKPAIECTGERACEARIRPFWSGAFPSDPEQIKVVTKQGE